MNIVSTIQNGTVPGMNNLGTQPRAPTGDAGTSPEFVEAFNTFVGQTFYGTMLKSMRSTVGKAAYLNGGRAEEVFTQQFDQVLAERLGKTSADKFSGPMLKLYQLQRM